MKTDFSNLNLQILEQLENDAWANPEALLESLICLLYSQWLEQQSSFFGRSDSDKRFSFWCKLGLRIRYRHLEQIVYPFLQTHAPMTGHLLGLILPTVPFQIPDARALKRLLELIEAYSPAVLCQAMLELIDAEEPSEQLLEEALNLLKPGIDSVIWEPYCHSGRFLAASARRIRRQHWQTLGLTPERLLRFRQAQFFGRVHKRSEAMLSAFNLLLAEQPAPRLDGYSLPWPRPDLIWAPGLEAEDHSSDLLEQLSAGGRLVFWYPSRRRQATQLNSGGSLEIISRPQIQVSEQVQTYMYEAVSFSVILNQV